MVFMIPMSFMFMPPIPGALVEVMVIGVRAVIRVIIIIIRIVIIMIRIPDADRAPEHR